jgi:hypothetical protein
MNERPRKQPLYHSIAPDLEQALRQGRFPFFQDPPHGI